MNKHFKTKVVLVLLAFLGALPLYLRAQLSVPVIQAPDEQNASSNAVSNGSTGQANPGKPKSKKTHGFKKAKHKKYSRYRRNSTKGNGSSGDNGSDGSQTEVSSQRDVSDQADNSKNPKR